MENRPCVICAKSFPADELIEQQSARGGVIETCEECTQILYDAHEAEGGE